MMSRAKGRGHISPNYLGCWVTSFCPVSENDQCKNRSDHIGDQSGFVGAVTLVFFTFEVLTFAIPSAQATPAIAKGKPCSTCHAGSPPGKANLKKSDRGGLPP